MLSIHRRSFGGPSAKGRYGTVKNEEDITNKEELKIWKVLKIFEPESK